MKTYQQLISEIFDKKINLKEMDIDYDEESATYHFKTPKGQHIEVEIVADNNGDYEFSFQSDSSEPDNPTSKTNQGQGEEILIFSTVLHIFEEFLKIEDFPNFYLEATLSEQNRVSLYRKMLKLFVKKYPQYQVTETTKSPKAMRGFIRFDVRVK